MAGRKPKNEPMTKDEMIEAGKQARRTKIYRAESKEITDNAIRQTIQSAIADIDCSNGKEKIRLEDLEKVKSIARDYLEACAFNSIFPTMTGLAMALGHTRTNLYIYMQKKPDDDTAVFLTQFHDKLADILAESALKGNANNIAAIFILKALYGFKDTQTIEFSHGTMVDETTAEDIALRADLLD